MLEGVQYGADAPGVTAPGIRIYMRDTRAFSSLGGYQPSTYELSGMGDPAQINAARLTASMFPALGVSPLMGRGFTQHSKLGLAGCGVGAIAAVFATRLLRSLLFQVDALDPVVLVLATISIVLLALGASVIPAHRAGSVEPMEALRTD